MFSELNRQAYKQVSRWSQIEVLRLKDLKAWLRPAHYKSLSLQTSVKAYDAAMKGDYSIMHGLYQLFLRWLGTDCFVSPAVGLDRETMGKLFFVQTYHLITASCSLLRHGSSCNHVVYWHQALPSTLPKSFFGSDGCRIFHALTKFGPIQAAGQGSLLLQGRTTSSLSSTRNIFAWLHLAIGGREASKLWPDLLRARTCANWSSWDHGKACFPQFDSFGEGLKMC